MHFVSYDYFLLFFIYVQFWDIFNLLSDMINLFQSQLVQERMK